LRASRFAVVIDNQRRWLLERNHGPNVASQDGISFAFYIILLGLGSLSSWWRRISDAGGTKDMIGALRTDNSVQLGQEAKSAPATILVVEDEVLVRMLIADQLRNAGYSVIEAADADEALALLAHTFNVRLVLSDVQMPGSMDGIGLARALRSAYPSVKVMLASGKAAMLDEVQHDGFFPKPYDVAQIVNRIEALID
jgi:CheY-like chemotaxis protein